MYSRQIDVENPGREMRKRIISKIESSSKEASPRGAVGGVTAHGLGCKGRRSSRRISTQFQFDQWHLPCHEDGASSIECSNTGDVIRAE
jgi:hypothetical protein